MAEIGYYRIKLDTLPVGLNEVSFYKNGNLAVTHIVDVKPKCENNITLKYLDRNGQYRFYSFNSRYETSNKPTLIGKTNKFVTSILNDQSDTVNLGYKNKRVLSLVADNVSSAELVYLQDIITTPRIYLHTGTGDSLSNWIEVTRVGGDNVSKQRKLEFAKFSIEIELPNWYTVTAL